MDEFYHAREVKTYFETGKLFYTGSTPYVRSRAIALLAIASEYLFTSLHSSLTQEFILRFPIALLGLLNVLLVYLITRKISSSWIALMAAAFIGTETYLMYFAQYLRFYTPSITLILLLILWNLSDSRRRVLLYSCVLSVLGYFLIDEYLLFYAAFFFVLYLIKVIGDFMAVRRSELAFALILTVAATLGLFQIVNLRVDSLSTYNLVSWHFNSDATVAMSKWLAINYWPYFLSLGFVIVQITLDIVRRRGFYVTNQNLLELCVLANLAFLFGFVVDVPFNFTFRVTLFFLPLLFVVFFRTLGRISADKYFIFALSALLIGLNLAHSVAYHLNQPGDYYYPTEPVYEKINILTGNKDLADFLSSEFPSNTKPDVAIGYVGLGNTQLQYYLSGSLNKHPVQGFRYSVTGDSQLSDLTEYLKSNSDKDVFIVISANAVQGRPNVLYQEIYDRTSVTEVSASLPNYIEGNIYFSKVYQSQDGVSTIYFRPANYK